MRGVLDVSLVDDDVADDRALDEVPIALALEIKLSDQIWARIGFGAAAPKTTP